MTHELEQQCEVCKQILTYIGRNRISNCGHMKRHFGKWILRGAATGESATGSLTEHQAAEIRRLSLEVAQATVKAKEADAHLSEATAALEEYLDAISMRGGNTHAAAIR
jgi:hypothetical protein